MTEKEIIEGNSLIAEFMGLEKEGNKYVDKMPDDFFAYPINDLNYRFSWDWLMPVIEKIESLEHPVFISSNNCTIYQNVGEDCGWIIDQYGKTKIEATWLSIIEFIKSI